MITRRYKLAVYQGGNWKWYWRLRHRNGRVVADGSQGYVRAVDCLRGASHVLALKDRSDVAVNRHIRTTS